MALLVSAAACGSSEGSGGDEETDEPKDEQEETTTTESSDDDTVAFDDCVDEVDQICAASAEEIAALGEPADIDEYASIAATATDLVATARDDIEAVGTPDENEDEVEEWLALLDEQAELYPDLVDAAEAGDEDALDEVIEEISDIEEDARAIAVELGLEEGGPDDSDDSTDPTDSTEVSASDLSFDEWVVAADAVCADFEAQSDELSAGLDEATTVEELAPAFEALIPLYESFLEEIEALGLPEDGPPEVAEWVALIGEGPERIQPLADAAAEGDEETFTELSSELEGYDQDLADAATAIGFQDCSQG